MRMAREPKNWCANQKILVREPEFLRETAITEFSPIQTYRLKNGFRAKEKIGAKKEI